MLISCVVPTHSRTEFLRESVQSIIDQTLKPFELIVVSDVLDSQARALCEELSASTDVPVIFEEDIEGRGGASGSRNAGARLASGSHIAFLDDDDLWEPSYLEHCSDVLADSDADCVVSWISMFKDGATALGLAIKPNVSVRTGGVNAGMTGSNVIIDRAAFFELEGFDENLRVMNDQDFFFRLLTSKYTFAVNARRDVLQRKHDQGQLTGRTESRALGIMRYLEKHSKQLTLMQRRSLLLSAERIRFHAASSRTRKLRHFLAGLWYSLPKEAFLSLRLRSRREFWLVRGSDS